MHADKARIDINLRAPPKFERLDGLGIKNIVRKFFKHCRWWWRGLAIFRFFRSGRLGILTQRRLAGARSYRTHLCLLLRRSASRGCARWAGDMH